MIEKIFRPENMAAMPKLHEIGPEEMKKARDRALLHRAITLAIESAFTHAQDFPVGAVAAAGNEIVGRSIASDIRLRNRTLHAERMAIFDAAISGLNSAPDTLVVSIEPCDDCQDFLATVPGLKRVGFGLSRAQVAAKGLVKPRENTIFTRALTSGLPFEVFQIEDEQLELAGSTILDYTSRDPQAEQVSIDQEDLHQALVDLNAS